MVDLNVGKRLNRLQHLGKSTGSTGNNERRIIHEAVPLLCILRLSLTLSTGGEDVHGIPL